MESLLRHVHDHIPSVDFFLTALRSFVTSELNLWPAHLANLPRYSAERAAAAVTISLDCLQFATSCKQIAVHPKTDLPVTIQVFRCNPAWAPDGVPTPRYDDVEINNGDDEDWFAKLLVLVRYTHHYDPAGTGSAVAQPNRRRRRAGNKTSRFVVSRQFNLAFVRSFYPDDSVARSERQPFQPLKLLPLSQLSHHVVHIESIMRRVFISPRNNTTADKF
jgi:hypothetical protein